DSRARRGGDLVVVQEAQDVDERRRSGDARQDFRSAEADRPRPAAKQTEATLEAESTHDLEEIPEIERVIDRRRRSGFVDAHLRLEPIEKHGVPAKLAEAEQILEKHPGMSAAARFLCERSRDDDRFHLRAPARPIRAIMSTPSARRAPRRRARPAVAEWCDPGSATGCGRDRSRV